MLKLSLGRLPKICRQRFYSSTISSQDLNIDALNNWIARPKQLSVIDTFRPEHLSDLYITLPTRDGTKQAYTPPEEFNELGYGHHLAFFHLRNPESLIRPDGTDANFCPPAPFTRRMWGGGKIHWVPDNPLLISSEATAKSTIVSVHKKGFEKGTPIVIVNQNIEICRGWDNVTHAVVEERSHIYLPQTAQVNRRVREVNGLPTSHDFLFKYAPTPTTLFRFSALTFNGHQIHLDKDYAQNVEGYPERLVHASFTALMLLETVVFHHPEVELKNFWYRATNPLLVNRPVTIYGAWKDKENAVLWCVDEYGVVGMTGSIEVV